MTSRGLVEKDFEEIASFVDRAIKITAEVSSPPFSPPFLSSLFVSLKHLSPFFPSCPLLSLCLPETLKDFEEIAAFVDRAIKITAEVSHPPYALRVEGSGGGKVGYS